MRHTTLTDLARRLHSCSIYVHLPFSTKAKVVHVASWTASQELSLKAKTALFPEKFNNFHSGLINITALPFRPYWVEEVTEAADGTILKTYAGSDGQLMNTLAERLNFTFRVMEVKDWDEVTSKVVERKAFMSGVYHVLLPQRRKRYDFTFAYERAITEFSMAKPALRPRWQSLYYPLDENVWFCILALLALTPLFALLIICGGKLAHKDEQADARTVTLEMVGSLLGQSIAERTGQRSGGRVMLASWLIFAFILTTAYRGNLTAALTLPKYPPRVETLPELVGVVDKITMPPYGAEFKEFFSQSDSIVFQTIAKKMQLVSNILDGLKGINEKQSHMDGERYLRLAIAEHFTLADGSNRLYVGRGSVLPTIAGLPIPHDAPYKPQVDRLLMTIIEAGLYEKWSEDMLNQARREGRQRERNLKKLQETGKDNVETEGSDDSIKALTIVHMQGPLMLLLLGLILALMVFVVEGVVSSHYNSALDPPPTTRVSRREEPITPKGEISTNQIKASEARSQPPCAGVPLRKRRGTTSRRHTPALHLLRNGCLRSFLFLWAVAPRTPPPCRRPLVHTRRDERYAIVRLWQSGLSARLIADETGTSTTTVYRWVRRWQEDGNVENKPRVDRNPFCSLGLAPGNDLAPGNSLQSTVASHFLRNFELSSTWPKDFLAPYAPPRDQIGPFAFHGESTTLPQQISLTTPSFSVSSPPLVSLACFPPADRISWTQPKNSGN
ncbi:Variant Ionotropic Glutamate Receptor [Penaeus vannamei]|uniref:Variant Ionotropic Glutamate Receptor n=1 Tax=Penaeus vannamei TaxID=6689 RepID=A0A423TS49_PENVA|nr:Variant Ionotropic Glutamate Receptor [Penaeus vannamei]